MDDRWKGTAVTGRPRVGDLPRSDAVLGAASQVFLQMGYAAASIDEIASRARASKSTVYATFGGKEGLFLAVVAAAVTRHRPAELTAHADRLPHEVVLTGFVTDLLDALLLPESLALLRVVAAESTRAPALGRRVFAALTGAGAEQLSAYFQRATAAGTLHVEHPGLAAFQLLGMVKEALFWPRLLGVDEPVVDADRTEVISRAVRTVIAAHRTP